MKKLINKIDSIDFDAIGNAVWAIIFIVNSTIIWIGPLFVDTNGMFYLVNMAIAMIVGIFGILTFFFPFILIGIAWHKLTKWAKS